MDAASLLKFATSSTPFTTGEAKIAFSASSRLVSLRRATKRASALRPALLPSRLCSTNANQAISSCSKKRARGPVMAAKKAAGGGKQEEGKYKHTIDLPKTTFGLRANSAVRELEIQKLWKDNQVYRRVAERNTGGRFVLHDGPPYTNGNLHMDHALNKILKDIINRYKLLQNHKVHFVPGWDCHGLPIELKVLQSMDQDARKELTTLRLREKAAAFAKETVKIQMKSFKRYGVWADWDNPYLTLSPEYEAAQIEVFGQMAMRGYIYIEAISRSIGAHLPGRLLLRLSWSTLRGIHLRAYMLFSKWSVHIKTDGLLEEFFPDLCLAIWMTTTWTIPANAGI